MLKLTLKKIGQKGRRSRDKGGTGWPESLRALEAGSVSGRRVERGSDLTQWRNKAKRFPRVGITVKCVGTGKRHMFRKCDFCWNSFRLFNQTTRLETNGSWNKKEGMIKAGPPLMYSIKHESFLIRHKGKNWKHHQRLNCLFAYLGNWQSESEWAAL